MDNKEEGKVKMRGKVRQKSGRVLEERAHESVDGRRGGRSRPE